MQTLRGRLTAWYSGALALTLAAFAGVLYLDRRSASYQDLDQRIQSEAALTAGILAESYRARGTLVRADTAHHPVLIPDLAALLEAVPDFLVITARDGSLLFASSDARALTFQQVEQLRRLASAPLSGRSSGTLRLEPNGPKIHYVVHYVTDAGPQIGAILAGADVRSAELGPDELLSTFALVLPLGLALALLMGSWISRRALAAVDQIITEVREITDGRSLHRRLAEPLMKDELGRLAETLNQMMTRLERSFAALRRFTADASHELKTPLTVLRAGVEVRETGELLAEEWGVRVEFTTPPEPIVVAVDATRIRQLILNLLTNAVKYTPPGGTVRMQLGSANGRVTLSVADTGIGIAPGDLPHIFDRFWRADSARTRTGERPGAGLGLAISKWIAEAHGGRIDVVSRPGRGTTFTVTLPREPPASKP